MKRLKNGPMAVKRGFNDFIHGNIVSGMDTSKYLSNLPIMIAQSTNELEC